MKRALNMIFLIGFLSHFSYSQSNFLVSTPAELKLVGMHSSVFISHHCYLLYNSNDSKLQMIVNMYELIDEHSVPQKGLEIEFDPNVLQDTNNLVFTCLVEEAKIRPNKPITDTYTFSLTGTARFRNVDYTTMIVCSYGAKMLRNNSNNNTQVVAINVNMEINRMDNPMYIPALKYLIDNLKVEIVDGTVNMIQL